jgi:carbon monoxide dehydrogenase subunit G
MTTEVSVSRDINADPAAVWAIISDLPHMGDISPENTGGRWLGGATGPTPGAKFAGTNQSGKKNWRTRVRVVTCQPPSTFAFDVTAGGLKVARWTYQIEPNDQGCRVTETWTDQRGPIVKALGKPVSGVADREAHNREGMEKTLENLKNKVDSDAARSSE